MLYIILASPIGLTVFPQAIAQLKDVPLEGVMQEGKVSISTMEIVLKLSSKGNPANAGYWGNVKDSTVFFPVTAVRAVT